MGTFSILRFCFILKVRLSEQWKTGKLSPGTKPPAVW